MAAYTASGWTVNILPTLVTGSQDWRRQGWIMGKQRRVRVRMDLSNATDGALYPSSGGIPFPSHRATTPGGDSSYGMVQHLDYLIAYGEGFTNSGLESNRVLWKYSPTAHAIRGFVGQYTTAGVGGPTELTELPTTWGVSLAAASGLSLYFEAVGW
jgi:hypothetical protein